MSPAYHRDWVHVYRTGVMSKTERIYDRLTAIFGISRAEGVPTSLVADRLAEERIRIARASGSDLKYHTPAL